VMRVGVDGAAVRPLALVQRETMALAARRAAIADEVDECEASPSRCETRAHGEKLDAPRWAEQSARADP
jgi:hypothetical protein